MQLPTYTAEFLNDIASEGKLCYTESVSIVKTILSEAHLYTPEMKKEMLPFIAYKEKLWKMQEQENHAYYIARNW